MRQNTARAGLVFIFLSLTLTACSGSGTGSAEPAIRLQGAGASFPAPLYMKWFRDYTTAHDHIQIDYQSVGSGSGIKNFIEKTVAFGASDAAMEPEEIAQVPEGVVLLPMTAGSIVLAYNLEGVTDLKLSRETYAGIFLGTVTRWNDPLIQSSNPGSTLPDAPINVVVRADSSGTTFVFTQHLSAISSAFAQSPGTNKSPNWPVGTRSKGNEGVTASIMTTPGSIGYVEYGYAAGQGLPMVALENKSGQYIAPSIEAGQQALAGAEMPADLVLWIPDPEGEGSYPIVSYTWLLCYKSYADAAQASALKDVIAYCLGEGQRESESLGYIPLPENVVEKVKAAVAGIS
jgi:phosphate transport system substrate-binding protein